MHLWSDFLKFVAKRYRRSTMWYYQRLLEVRREIRGELFDSEADLLGQLVETPHWKAFLKYLDIERAATTNNGLVHAQDLLGVGEVKGDIGRMNKIESDMKMFHEEMQLRNKAAALKKSLDEVMEEEQSTDI